MTKQHADLITDIMGLGPNNTITAQTKVRLLLFSYGDQLMNKKIGDASGWFSVQTLLKPGKLSEGCQFVIRSLDFGQFDTLFPYSS